jgi:hypothetical protein
MSNPIKVLTVFSIVSLGAAFGIGDLDAAPRNQAPVTARKVKTGGRFLGNGEFGQLQREFAQKGRVFTPGKRRRLLVLPSLSMDTAELAKLKGASHYEERQLFFALAAASRGTQVRIVTSEKIDPAIMRYITNLLPNGKAARRRIRMIAVNDASARPLTQKILERPSVLSQLRAEMRGKEPGVIVPFVSTGLENRLAVELGLPLLGSAKELAYWGTKAGSRAIFAESAVPHPDGIAETTDVSVMAEQIADLVERHPQAKKVVIKLNEGFSGEGNAMFDLRKIPGFRAMNRAAKVVAIKAAFAAKDSTKNSDSHPLAFEAPKENWKHFSSQIQKMGAIAELFVDGEKKTSPSVQVYIGPDGKVEVLSTHEQILGGKNGQVYLGATFPADAAYRVALTEAGRKIGERLAAKGVVGRFAADFLAVQNPANPAKWNLQAIEVNLRSGGTTHPTNTLKLLIDGKYDEATGLMKDRNGKAKYYVATDNAVFENLKGLTVQQLERLARRTGVHWNKRSKEGAVFHMLGALKGYGKCGFTAIGDTPEQAQKTYDRTMAMLRDFQAEASR